MMNYDTKPNVFQFAVVIFGLIIHMLHYDHMQFLCSMQFIFPYYNEKPPGSNA